MFIKNKITEGVSLSAGEGPKFGKVEIVSTPNQADGSNPRLGFKEKVLVDVVISGVCGTDLNLIEAAKAGRIASNFAPRTDYMIIGHEGVIYSPKLEQYGVVVVRGGNALLPHRCDDGDEIFEYGIYKEDGLHCRQAYINPEMIVWIPDKVLPRGEKISFNLLKKLLFAEPYAVVKNSINQAEDVIVGVNGKIAEARKEYEKNLKLWWFDYTIKEIALSLTYSKGVVISAAGTIGTIAAFLYHKRLLELMIEHENSPLFGIPNIVVVDLAESDSPKAKLITKQGIAKYVRNKGDIDRLVEEIKHALGDRWAGLFVGCGGYPEEGAIGQKVLGHNGIYSNLSLDSTITIDTTDLSLENLTITGSVNFSRDDMKKAVEALPAMPFDKMATVYDCESLRDSGQMSRIFGKASSGELAKRAILWNPDLVKLSKKNWENLAKSGHF